MRQMKIFQDSDQRTVEEGVNEFLAELTKVAEHGVELQVSTMAAGPAEDQFVITTVMIVFDE